MMCGEMDEGIAYFELVGRGCFHERVHMCMNVYECCWVVLSLR